MNVSLCWKSLSTYRFLPHICCSMLSLIPKWHGYNSSSHSASFSPHTCFHLIINVICVVAYMSIRNEKSGSLFIRTLVTTLYKHASHRDMWSLFEIVSATLPLPSCPDTICQLFIECPHVMHCSSYGDGFPG